MDDATPMMNLFAQRERMIRRGHFKAMPPLYKATPPGELREKRRRNFFKSAEYAAVEQAKMDRSDPFLFKRAMAQMELGIFTPGDVPHNRRISV